MQTKRGNACRIIARSLFRELTANGYQLSDVLAVATELLDSVVRDAATTRTGGGDSGRQGELRGQRRSSPLIPSELGARNVLEVNMHFKNVLRFIQELKVEVEGVTMNSRLGGDLGMDSQEIVELAILIEKAYEIRVPERALSKGSTIGDVIEQIERLLTARATPAPTRDT